MDPADLKKWRRIRWIAVAAYILFLLGLTFIPVLLGMDETMFLILYFSLFIISFLPFIYILNRPYHARLKGGSPDEMKRGDTVRGRIKEPTLKVFKDHVDMWIMLVIIIPVALATAIPLIMTMDIVMIAIALGTLLFFALILALFYRLRIEADREHILFHYGPIGKTLEVKDIRSIEAIEVHALKDFMGWGIRSGTDGSLGYISNSKTGIKIVMNSNKAYVVSCNRPNEVVQLVTWARDHHS